MTNFGDPACFRRAQEYLEAGRLKFFDFARHILFGFVEEDRGGHYCQVEITDSRPSSWKCSCSDARNTAFCHHMMAIFLRAQGWPKKQPEFVWQRFDRHRLTALVRHIPPEKLDLGALVLRYRDQLEDIGISTRWLEFMANSQTALAQRDRKAWREARMGARSAAEKKMSIKGFPSTLMRFEESEFYLFAKLLVKLMEHESLELVACANGQHQVTIQLNLLGESFFQWHPPIEKFIRGLKKDLFLTADELQVVIQKESSPLVYQIDFDESGRLAIRPKIQIGEQIYQAPGPYRIKNSHYYHHPKMGYFSVQSGLSPFELAYGSAEESFIERAQVDRWIKEHKSTLGCLDRSLMDPVLFDGAVIDSFDRFLVQCNPDGEDVWHVQITAYSGAYYLGHAELVQARLSKDRYAPISGRLLDTHGQDFALLKTFVQLAEGELMKADRLSGFMARFRDRIEWSNKLDIRLQTLIAGKCEQVPDLAHTMLNLRPYQQVGYEWLWFLKSFGLGGLLCDQMGLGKTHQTMALMSAVHEKKDTHSLVVCPTSVIHHWHDTLSKFCPLITTAVLHGSYQPTTKGRSHVTITSYGTLRSHAHKFNEQSYDLVVFDEIQALKNPKTKVFEAASQIDATCRIGLTGTPIENQLDDLKTLFDMVYPGLLGSNIDFKHQFGEAIFKFASKKAQRRLSSIIQPFILRRAKSEVLTDLPPKEETWLRIDLSDYEAGLYKRMLDGGLDEMNDKSPTFMHAFQLLGRLKQLCNHPAMILGLDQASTLPAAKWEAFTQLLDEALQNGKVVVFSQYLQMLELIRRHLKHKGIGYASITGATSDRKQQVDRFQSQDDCRVFVGSLNASGVGINLTAAATVIHYDRWWNAAREEQATDRVHRIGQKESVQVYRFVVRSTIEERIDELIERKRALLEDVVEFDASTAQKALSLKELMEILK